MIKITRQIAFVALFFALVTGAFVGIYYLHPYYLYFYLSCLALMIARHGLGIKFWLTEWADRVMTSIDQHWQVICSPLLNLIAPDIKYKFGNPDETASSVVGKNINARGQTMRDIMHWLVIEWVLSRVLEAGRPHSVPSIEEDEY